MFAFHSHLGNLLCCLEDSPVRQYLSRLSELLCHCARSNTDILIHSAIVLCGIDMQLRVHIMFRMKQALAITYQYSMNPLI